jgi:hypothetical protein
VIAHKIPDLTAPAAPPVLVTTARRSPRSSACTISPPTLRCSRPLPATRRIASAVQYAGGQRRLNAGPLGA